MSIRIHFPLIDDATLVVMQKTRSDPQSLEYARDDRG